MSVDIATLGIRVDSTQARTADKDLDNLAKSGGNAEKSFGALTGASGLLRQAMLALPTLAVGAAISGAIVKAKEFSNSMAEISTLVDTAKFNMDGFTDSLLKQAGAYNSTPFAQSKAAYQIISAGATSAAKATEILTASNRLAVGGVTDVAIAADGLTSILNAYGDKVASAEAVSDALFVGMKGGKTTIAELSNSLGAVAPIAAQLGVTFDELVASISAVTKGGVATNVAATGMRAILAAVAKPSDEAAKLAAKLGIEFSSAAIQAKGLTGFLSDLKDKTHGNSDALAILFGGVEALVPIMALTGEAGGFFTEIMVGMGEKTGATGEAFDKIAAGPAYRIGVIFSTITAKGIELGTALLNFLNPALGALSNALTGTGEQSFVLDAALKALAATAAVLVVRSIVGMTTALIGSVTAWLGANSAVLLFQMNLARYGAAAAIATAATTTFTAAVTRLMALLGGPWGVLILGSAAAMYAFKKSNDDTGAALEALSKKTGVTTGRMGEMREAAIAAIAEKKRLSFAAYEAAKGMGAGAQKAGVMAQALVQLGIAAQYAEAQTAKLGLSQARSDLKKKTDAYKATPKWDFVAKETQGRDVLAARDEVGIAAETARQAASALQFGLKPIKAGGSIAAPKLDLNTDTPKAGGGKSSKEVGKSDAQRELEDRIKSAKEFADSLDVETTEIGKNQVELKMMAIERAAVLAPTKELAKAIRDGGVAWKEANDAQENSKFKEALGDQIDQIQFENSLIGKNAVEREKAIVMQAIEARVRDAARNGVTLDMANIAEETRLLIENATARGAKVDAVSKVTETANAMRDAASAVREMTEGFGELFGTAGEGFSNLINTVFEYGAAQAEIAEQQAVLDARRNEAGALNASDEAEYARNEQEAARNKIANYGNMIGAAKTFFKEGSTGYKVLEGAERAYRLFQFAMQAKAIIMDVLQTGSSVANSGTRAAASGVEAVAKAMASLPPPFNFIAAGAVIAFLVAMGVKMVGGKGGGGASKSASQTSEKAVEQYKGPRDEYGAPTSGYSVLKPGATTVAPGNRMGGGGSGFGSSVTVGDTTLIVQGSMDSATLPQVEAMLDNSRQQTVEEARQVVANDFAQRGARQRIGGA